MDFPPLFKLMHSYEAFCFSDEGSSQIHVSNHFQTPCNQSLTFESLLALLQLFLCEKENPFGFSNCFLSLGKGQRRKSDEFSNHLGGLALEQRGSCLLQLPLLSRFYKKIQAKQNISSEEQETNKRRGGLSIPVTGSIPVALFSKPWISNSQSSTCGQMELCGFWESKRPHSNSEIANRTFF